MSRFMRGDNTHLQRAAIEEFLVDKPVLISNLRGLDAGDLEPVDALFNCECSGLFYLGACLEADEENDEGPHRAPEMMVFVNDVKGMRGTE